mgnify:CR=1 FL=1
MKNKLILALVLLNSLLVNAQSFQLLKDITPGNWYGSSNLQSEFYEHNSKVYFNLSNGTIMGLYVTDGTDAGTTLLSTTATTPGGYVLLNNKVFFAASDATNGFELWSTDGTAAGTQLFKDFNSGTGSGVYASSIYGVVNNKLIFWANDGTATKLWVTDGTLAGTSILNNDAISAGYTPHPDDNHIHNNKMYFFAGSGSLGNEIWVSDGTSTGTYMIKNINTNAGGSSVLTSSETIKIVALNNKMYFSATASNAAVSSELWETDGTDAGTKLAVDIRPGGIGSRINDMIVFNNKIYLVADRLGISGPKLNLISTDGTDAGTNVLDTVFDANLPEFYKMKIYNNELYMRVDHPSLGTQLFKLNNNNEVVCVKAIGAGLNAGRYTNFEIYDNKLWFIGSQTAGYTYIWNTDGTEAGTTQVTPVNALEYFGGFRNNLKSTSIGLFTLGFTAAYGAEVWVYKSGGSSNILSQNKTNTFSVYPNPSSDIINIKIENPTNENLKIKVLNTLSQVILNDTFSSDNFTFSTQNMNKGIYYIQIENKDNITTQKIIIK